MTKVYFSNVTPLLDSSAFNAAIKRVSLKRQTKVNALKKTEDKILSLGAGLIFDYAIKDFTGKKCPCDIDYEKSGKPTLAGNKNIFVSISHSGETALCALSDSPVGADIQVCTGFKDDICQRFFTKSEADFVFNFESNFEKMQNFFRIWTLKESYAKLTGKGIMSFKSFEIDLSNGPCAKKDGKVLPVSFCEYELLNYKLAVCVQANTNEITFENISHMLIN